MNERNEKKRIECTTETKASNANLNYNNNGFYIISVFFTLHSQCIGITEYILCSLLILCTFLFHTHSLVLQMQRRCAFSFAIKNFNSEFKRIEKMCRELSSSWLSKRWLSSQRINNLRIHTYNHTNTHTHYSLSHAVLNAIFSHHFLIFLTSNESFLIKCKRWSFLLFLSSSL